MSAPLWCCHVLGPDDVYAAPDKATAQAWADKINFWAGRTLDHENDPVISAVVAEWPWSAEAHAAAVRKSIANFASREPGR